jgi:hypothetical protein
LLLVVIIGYGFLFISSFFKTDTTQNVVEAVITPTMPPDTPTLTSTIEIKCPTLTPLASYASDKAKQDHFRSKCMNGQWIVPTQSTFLQPREGTSLPSQKPWWQSPPFHHMRIKRPEVWVAIFTAILFSLKWIARFLAVFFDYLSRFADYILNLLRKQDD